MIQATCILTRTIAKLGVILFSAATLAGAGAADVVTEVELQPLAAQVRRVIEALDHLGAPLDPATRTALAAAMQDSDAPRASKDIQAALAPHCLFRVHINPESRVKVAPGPAAPQLVQHGWRHFLVQIVNEAGVTAALRAESPNAQKLAGAPATDLNNRWLDLMMFDSQPLQPKLSGLKLEYRILQLYSRDAGQREARLTFDVGQGTQDLGFRNQADLLFRCAPAHSVTLRVRDEKGEPTTAAFVIRDPQNRVYPSPAKRLAPDFAFHPQIYRADGEALQLPDGQYSLEFSRGPESIRQKSTLTVAGQPQTASFQVQRWIDPAQFGYWSGDHHIHAAGCAHYVAPTEGVRAADMIRHCLGEDLKIGANLTWGPCFDFQKQFFCGAVDPVSQYPYLLRYDIEVSGFGSHESGHLCLLRLQEGNYPGGESFQHWPMLGLNTSRWAKKQGAVCGPAHSGLGLQVPTNALPNYLVPPYDGIGANEYIVNVTHLVAGPDDKLVPAVDFISLVDTPPVFELNIWYHTLNVGFRTRGSGETDFPCLTGQRVGMGRSYVRLDGILNYDAWCEGIRQGRSYVSDGRSHLLEFKVNDAAVGENGSEFRLSQPGIVRVAAKVAARLEERPNPELQNRPPDQKPYWNLERARRGNSREVRLEVVVNGFPVAEKNIVADGELRDVGLDVKVDRSSWVALRILPSSHTNPIWVLVDGQPVSPSRRSAEWCLQGVDQCWSQKQRFIKAGELDDARKAYDHARSVYRGMIASAEFE